MPGRVYSALNTGGTPYATPADDQAARNQAQSADWMLQQAMLQQRAQQFQASLADKQNDRLAQRDIQGTYSQRAAGDQALAGLQGQYGLENTKLAGQNQVGYATAINQPHNREIDMAKTQWDAAAPQRDLMNTQAAYDTARLKTKGRLIDLIQGEIFSGNSSPDTGVKTGTNPGTNAPSPGQEAIKAGNTFAGILTPRDRQDFARSTLGLSPIADQSGQVSQFLLNSTDPQQRAAGARLYATQSGGSIDAQVQAALAKRVLPLDQAGAQPEVQTAINRARIAAGKVAGNSYIGSRVQESPEYIDLSSAIDEAVNGLVKNGVDRAQAHAFVINKLSSDANGSPTYEEGGLDLGNGIYTKGRNELARNFQAGSL